MSKIVTQVYMIVIMVSCLFIGYQARYIQEYYCIGCDCIEYNNESSIIKVGSLPLFINETYSDKYNCINFSKDLVSKLEDRNVTAVRIGYRIKGNSIGHQVIGLLIEPQNGRIVPIQEYEYMRIVNNE